MPKKNNEVFPDPPEHLSDEAKNLYREYVGSVVRAPGQIALMVSGLESFDQMNAALGIIRDEGLTIVTGKSGLRHAHPAVAIAKESRAQFIKICTVLNLQFDHHWHKPGPYDL